MTTRHIRGSTELKPLIEDTNYDFNFQSVRILPEEVSVYPVMWHLHDFVVKGT